MRKDGHLSDDMASDIYTRAPKSGAIKIILGLLAVSAVLFCEHPFARPLYNLELGEPKLGFDQEVEARGLRWLTSYFDLNYLESWVRSQNHAEWLIDEEIAADYVLSKEAFFNLPPELQAELAHGLDLQRATRLQITTPQLLDSQGKPLGVTAESAPLQQQLRPWQPTSPSLSQLSRLRITAPTGVISGRSIDPLAELRRRSAETIVSDWPVLLARWNSLPLVQKQPHIRFRHLDASKVATLILKLPVEMKNSEQLMEIVRLNSAAPAWMNHVIWSLDGRIPRVDDPLGKGKSASFEFAYRGTTSDRQHIENIVAAALVEMKIVSVASGPQHQRRLDSAFHWHVSYSAIQETYQDVAQNEFLARLELYKLLILVRVLAGGTQNESVLTDTSSYEQNQTLVPFHLQNIFDTPIKKDHSVMRRMFGVNFDKGLVHLVKPHHTEIREQTAHPNAVLEEFLDLFSLVSADAFKSKIATQIEALLSAHPDIIIRIARANPKILGKFRGVLSESKILEELVIAIHQAPRNSKEFGEIFRAIMNGGPTVEVAQTLLGLAESGLLRLSHNLIFEFGNRPEIRQFFLQEFIRRPQNFDSSALGIVSAENVISNYMSEGFQKDDAYKAAILYRILGRWISNGLHGYSSPEIPQQFRKFLMETPTTGESRYWADLFIVASDPDLDAKLESAQASGLYPDLNRKSLVTALYILTNHDPHGMHMGWYFNWWGYQAAQQEKTDLGNFSGYEWIARRVAIRDPHFFALFAERIDKQGLSDSEFKTLVHMITVFSEAGEPARQSGSALMARLRHRNPDLVDRYIADGVCAALLHANGKSSQALVHH